jgi:hypothetical protein
MSRRTVKKPEPSPKSRPDQPARGAHEPRAGAEAVPQGTVEQHHGEQESGYGGKKSEPRVSADQQ